MRFAVYSPMLQLDPSPRGVWNISDIAWVQPMRMRQLDSSVDDCLRTVIHPHCEVTCDKPHVMPVVQGSTVRHLLTAHLYKSHGRQFVDDSSDHRIYSSTPYSSSHAPRPPTTSYHAWSYDKRLSSSRDDLNTLGSCNRFPHWLIISCSSIRPKCFADLSHFH
jgi:hypothetical protein